MNSLQWRIVIPVALISAVFVYYYGFYEIYVNTKDERTVFPWLVTTWNEQNDLLHGFAVPFLFIGFTYSAFVQMREFDIERGWIGLPILLFGVFCYLIAARTLQPRIALVALPFLIVGCSVCALGWKRGRYMLFPAFFWWFAMPVPGLNQMTNFLQIFVTEACFYVGTWCGMDLINSGNNIHSASDKWDFNIAEGCSGVRSLMALVMIAAIYAYYTQRELWKKVVVFASSLPLALFGNFCRVFTILVLAELGFDEFAGGMYHDFAGLLIFFPAALGGLLLLDRLLNPQRFKKKVKVTHKG